VFLLAPQRDADRGAHPVGARRLQIHARAELSVVGDERFAAVDRLADQTAAQGQALADAPCDVPRPAHEPHRIGVERQTPHSQSSVSAERAIP